MGASGPGPFENDDALDWIWKFEESGSAAIEKALAAVEAASDYLEAPDATIALAAMEAVASARGNPAVAAPDDFLAAVDKYQDAIRQDEPLRTRALQAVIRILEPDSELKELWADTDYYEAWMATVRDLKDRLM